MSIPDETLMAYVDGELDPTERAAVEAAIQANPEIAGRVAGHRALRDKLSAAYEPELAEPVPDRLLAVVRGRPAGQGPVVDLARARAGAAAAPRRPWLGARSAGARWRYPASLAASVLVALGLAVFAWQRTPLLEERGGALVASGELARDLSRSLAGEGTPGGGQVGLSFLAKSGDYCRTFTLRESAGLACRSGERWLIRDLAALSEDGVPQSEYRTAASSLPPAIAAAVQAQIAGEPLDRAGEVRARERGWRPR